MRTMQLKLPHVWKYQVQLKSNSGAYFVEVNGLLKVSYQNYYLDYFSTWECCILII